MGEAAAQSAGHASNEQPMYFFALDGRFRLGDWEVRTNSCSPEIPAATAGTDWWVGSNALPCAFTASISAKSAPALVPKAPTPAGSMFHRTLDGYSGPKGWARTQIMAWATSITGLIATPPGPPQIRPSGTDGGGLLG